MVESAYDVIQLIGTSSESWERPPRARSSKPPKLSVTCASRKIVELDMIDPKGRVEAYRAKVKLSFKLER